MRINFYFFEHNKRKMEGEIMASEDTIKLLKECNAGVKTAVTSIDEVLEHIKDEKLKTLLIESKKAHEVIGDATHNKLIVNQDEDKEPNPMAKAMSWMKINGKLMMHEKDCVVADLMTDGCNMGIKSVSRYMNQYPAADEFSRGEAEKLIRLEQKLMDDLRAYL